MVSYICVRCGGHFAGSTVLHWAAGAEGRGAHCTGDTLHVVEDHLDTYSHMLPSMGSEAATAMEDALSGDH